MLALIVTAGGVIVMETIVQVVALVAVMAMPQPKVR